MKETAQINSHDVWKTFGFWAFWVGIAFFFVYPICNWLTSQRSHPFALYLESELKIPFIPEFVWIYISMYVIFLLPPMFLDVPRLKVLGMQLVAATIVSGLIFVIIPAKLGFSRAVPDNPIYGPLFSAIFAVDLPHNMVPSLHIVFSALILWSVVDISELNWIKVVAQGWLILLCASTVLVHQHHVLDVMAGLGLALCLRHWITVGDSHA